MVKTQTDQEIKDILTRLSARKIVKKEKKKGIFQASVVLGDCL